MTIQDGGDDLVKITPQDIGEIPKYHARKCYDATVQNIQLFLQMLADPGEYFKIELSGGLLDAASGGLGSLAQFSQDYLKKNAFKIAAGVMDAAGIKEGALLSEGIDKFYKMLAIALQANQFLIFVIAKIPLRNIINLIDLNRKNIEEIQQIVIELTDAVNKLGKGSDSFEEYKNSLVSAYNDVSLGRQKVLFVTNTFRARNIFLTKTWKEAKELAKTAQGKIKESRKDISIVRPFRKDRERDRQTRYPDSNITRSARAVGNLMTDYLEIASDGSIPTSAEQQEAFIKIPRLSHEITKKMGTYSTRVSGINLMLNSFYVLTDESLDAFVNTTKRLAVKQLQTIHTNFKTLEDHMGAHLGRGPNSQGLGRNLGNPANLAVQAFKWSTDLYFLMAEMDLVSEDGFAAIGRTVKNNTVYTDTVKNLKALGDIKQVGATLLAQEAKEDVGTFETQILSALLQANATILSFQNAKRALPLLGTIMRRLEIAKGRGEEIKIIINRFLNHRFEGEEDLMLALKAIEDFMKLMKMDKALDFFNSGDLVSFFNLNDRTATTVGAALAAIGALKACFSKEKTLEDVEKLTDTERELERELDLVNIKISFELDSAFLKNLKVCEDAIAAMQQFNVSSLLCKLATESLAGKTLKTLQDKLSVSDAMSSVDALNKLL
jgi:hypothetical protein